MLSMTSKQIKVFEQSAIHSFEDNMLLHLAGFSPPLYQALGEMQMREAISFGVAQAGFYGFTQRGPVRTYLEMMLIFGSHFDSDPQYPWAEQILRDRSNTPQMLRAQQLYDRTVDYLDKVAGPDDSYALAAYKKLAFWAQQPLKITANNFVNDMVNELVGLYPQKAHYVGRDHLETLVRKGMGGAQRQHFTTVRDAVLVTILMFAFGHGCGADPLYPWIGKSLNDEPGADPELKAKRLEKNALTWLSHVIAYFDTEAPA